MKKLKNIALEPMHVKEFYEHLSYAVFQVQHILFILRLFKLQFDKVILVAETLPLQTKCMH